MKSGTGRAFIAVHKRKAAAARAPYIHTLQHAVKLQRRHRSLPLATQPQALAFAGGTAPPSKGVARAGPCPGHGGLGAKTWPKPHNFGTSPWFQSRNCPCRPGGAATPCAAAPVQPEFVDTRNESLRSSSAFGCWGGRTRRRSMVAHSPWPLSWDPFSLLAYRPLRRSHACWRLPGAGRG